MKNVAKAEALKQHKKLRETLLNALNNKEMTEETYKNIWNEVSFLRCKINNINECEGSMQPSTESKLNMPVVNNSLQDKLYGALIMTVISALMWLIYILANCC